MTAPEPDVRERPYMTEPARVQWGPLVSVALVALYLTLGRDPGRPWSAVLALVLALVILSRAFSAIRTQHVEFVVPSGLRIEADRHPAPVRYWFLTGANWAFGLLILAIAASDAFAYLLRR
jgi:hypothetical protein